MQRSRPNGEVLPRFGQVRGTFWLLLIGAVLLTLAVPGLALWRAAASPLEAVACLWPAAPRTQTPTYVLVTLANPTDRTAVQGPWAELAVQADMPGMAMGTAPRVVHGPPSAAQPTTLFSVPLRLAMVGSWRIHVALHTPGRPMWQSILQVTVLPPQATAQAPPADVGLPVQAEAAPCASS